MNEWSRSTSPVSSRGDSLNFYRDGKICEVFLISGCTMIRRKLFTFDWLASPVIRADPVTRFNDDSRPVTSCKAGFFVGRSRGAIPAGRRRLFRPLGCTKSPWISMEQSNLNFLRLPFVWIHLPSRILEKLIWIFEFRAPYVQLKLFSSGITISEVLGRTSKQFAVMETRGIKFAVEQNFERAWEIIRCESVDEELVANNLKLNDSKSASGTPMYQSLCARIY